MKLFAEFTYGFLYQYLTTAALGSIYTRLLIVSCYFFDVSASSICNSKYDSDGTSP